MLIVRPACPADAELHWNHHRRQGQERGRDGAFIYSPIDESWNVPLETFVKTYGEKFARPVTDPGWERVWVISDQNEIYGDLTLTHRPPLKSCLHRATLMMGIEHSHRSHGFGSRLIEAALSWARGQPSLVWIELFVFDSNTPARKLYSKFGFRENATTVDMFRVHGKQISDVSMILKLK